MTLRAGVVGCGFIGLVHGAALRAFVDAVLAGRPPEPGIGEALTAHRLVEASYRSARERGPVDLGE